MKKLINFYQKLTFLQGTAFAISILTVAGLSAHSLSPFNIFTSGQTISASAVNTNFNTLAEAIEASSTMSYLGVWDATSSLPSASLPGDYYIINVADGSYNLNDKIVWNGSSFDQVYADAQWTKTGNDISYDLGNVSIAQKLRLKSLSANYVELKAPSSVSATYTLTLPPNSGSSGQVLSTDGTGTTFWSNMTDPNVQPFAMSALPTCMAGEVLKSNGTAFSCVTDNAGAAAFSGAANRAIVTDGAGFLSTSATISTELGYVSGVTSSIQTQLNNKLSLSGGSMTSGALNITGAATLIVPTPITSNEAANKMYVDSNITSTINLSGIWNKSGVDINFISGNVGIGTASPSSKLDVNGQINSTSALNIVSDQRYKKEITLIPNALEKILKIDGVSYKFKKEEFPNKEFSDRRELGVIAQKVEKVFPEAVSINTNGFRSVAYTMLIAPIIEAIRSLDSKQKNLEAENKILKEYLCTRDPMAPFCED